LHVPGIPIYLGELVLLIGVAEAIRVPLATRAVILGSPILRILLLFMAGCTFRFLVDVSAYKLEALRDSAVWYYGVYAFVVAAAARANPDFVSRLFDSYRRVIPAYLMWAPVAVVLGRLDAIAFVPGSITPVNSFKPGDIGVNVAMALGVLWISPYIDPNMRKRSNWAVPFGIFALMAAGSQNRGGLIAGLTVLVLVLHRMPAKRRVLATVFAWTAGVFVILIIFNPKIDVGSREVSLDQIKQNVSSIFASEDRVTSGAAGSSNLYDTTSWRLDFWGKVLNDSFSSSYVVGGQGFGPNLADKYGFQAGGEFTGNVLRSAHNSHVTLLARAGLPLTMLWFLLWGTLIWSLRARSVPNVHGPVELLPAWIAAAIAGILVNAIFDPVIEGPQVGIPLWVLVGVAAHLCSKRTQRTPSTL